ncbi:hypothetical protein AHMF7605_28740 [Adhaeribacter arboris]|uniref:Metallo-beta-lactamase domain-containing protein n=2 Tax=Adhaeribacter arboris TaxID=2072846 RepID=A0A2T2Y920_9BACT|nr:hypothetical protein AHMF7605_28740 [Adhaeribacter arboris]
MNPKISVQLLRHATLIIHIGKQKLLVDPMLASKGELDPVQNCGNNIRIPMVDLPLEKDALQKILSEVDAIVVTHLHRDHWDLAAQTLINKDKLIFCQPSDLDKIKKQGFTNVTPIDQQLIWKDIKIFRTKGKHGSGEIGQKMGEVSGFVFASKQQSVYLAGDTIWCDDVNEALKEHQPTAIIVNAGGAQFLSGGPITMTPEDIRQVYAKQPNAKIIAVHMDTVNHCFVKRTALRKALQENNLVSKVIIPFDGDLIPL